MTKVSEPPASKLQELLADYLSQNLKDSEDEVKCNESKEDDQNSSRRHKKHKHKSKKKKKKKSHHSEKEDERHNRSGRSLHRKHKHSDRDRHSGSRRHSESKEETRESRDRIAKERTLVDVPTVSCSEQQKLKDKIKDVAKADDSKEIVSTGSKAESHHVLHSIEVKEVPKSQEKRSALQKFFRDFESKDEKSNDSEDKTSSGPKPQSSNVAHKIEEELKNQEKISPLKSFFRDSMSNWRGKEAQKLIDENFVPRSVHSSENQKESKSPDKVITDCKGAIRITIHSTGSEKCEITDSTKESVTKDSKNVWHTIVPSSVRQRKRKNSESINMCNVKKSSNVALSRPNVSEKLFAQSKDIERESESKEVTSDSVNIKKDAKSEKCKEVDENKDTGQASNVKAKVDGESYNVWYKIDLESEKCKLTDENKYVEKSVALKEEVGGDCNTCRPTEKQQCNDESKGQYVNVESKEIISTISDVNLNENFSKKDTFTSEQLDIKREVVLTKELEMNDQCKKERRTTGETANSFGSNETPSVGPENASDTTKDKESIHPSAAIYRVEVCKKNLENVKGKVWDYKEEITAAVKINQNNSDPGNTTFILPRKTENTLDDSAHFDKKVSKVTSVVQTDKLLPDLLQKDTEILPTVDVQVSIINSTTAVLTESEVQCKNSDKIILPGSALNTTFKGDGMPSGDVVPLATEMATKPKGKIVIKDLTVCHALKNAEEERLLKLSQMEEGEVEDSGGENEAQNSGRSTPQTDEGSGLISDEDENKLMVKKKKRKRSKHKEKRKKKKLEKDQSKIERSHSSSKRERKSKKVDGHDQKSKPRRDSITEKGKNPSLCEKILSPSRKARSRSPHHKPSTNRTRSPERRARSPLHRGRGRTPPRGGRITSPLRGFRIRDRRRSPNKQPQIFRDLREKIDKKKLLEIARKNVLQMMQDGTLPAGLNVNALKQEQVIAIKAGGKGVNELTEFCRSLVETGDDSSSDEKQLSDEEGDMPFIHHPFKLRDLQPTIRLNIRNAVQLPTKTPAEKTADAARLRLQFPVSSGSHHRNHELEWVPVEKTEESPSHKKSKEPVPSKPVMDLSNHPLAQFIAPGPMSALAPPPPPPPLPPPPPPPPIEKIEVFPSQKSLSMDIASAMLMRVKAVQRLQENPHDMEALNQMYQAQQQMQEWAQSKLLPGQFGALGDTRMLTPEELSGPTPVWVKKELFIKAAPLRGGIGMHLLKKMGWNPGEGLGKNKEGSLEPLMLDIKTDKKGLVSTGELPQKTVLPTIKMPRDLSAKHPVSALMELCSKRKWGTPDYTLLDETGPAHRKTFLFKVKVKGIDYQPSVSSSNKKQAKALAASVCLQSMGLLPRNLNKPT